MFKLCVFDFDSTLMDGETIDLLAAAHGVGEQVRQITARAMAGELDFFESLTARVALLRGMRTAAVREVCESLPLMPGAPELIAHLRSRGVRVVVFSGGFHEGIDVAQARLGFDIGFANFLHEKNGVLTGLVGGEMMKSTSKGEMLARLRGFVGAARGEVACVGDGANDLAMFGESGLRVAFCAKPVLRAAADVCVDEKDLTRLIGLF